jgi:hypothetical protein
MVQEKQNKYDNLKDDKTNDYSLLYSFILCLDLSPILFTVKPKFGLIATFIFEFILLVFGFSNLFFYIKKYKNALLRYHWININWLLCIAVYLLISLSLSESFNWIKPYVMFLIVLQFCMLIKYHAILIGKPVMEIIITKRLKRNTL